MIIERAEELTINKDITYCVTSDKALCFDMYYPKDFVPLWFIEQSKENGYQTEIMIHPQEEHGFDYVNHDKYTKEIIERTVIFIKQ